MRDFRHLMFAMCSVIVVIGRCAAADATSEKPIPIGLHKQLFVDDYVISEKQNVVRTLGKVSKANGGKPVLTADRPWETDNILIGSVFREGNTFKMYYKVGYSKPEPNDPPGTTQLRVAYAESTDGLHWTKPNLGIRTFEGNKENNLVHPLGMTCLPDPNETDPEHKYKAAYSHWQQMKAAIAHSADGINWTPYNGGSPVTPRAADTVNQIVWDPQAKTYRLYTRTDYQQELRAKIEVRGTRDMTNPHVKADPTAWKTVREWALQEREPEEYKRRQIYSLNGWFYEGVHFGLLWSYEWPGDLSEGPHDLHARHERDIMNFFLLTTRNDEPWNLEWVYANKPLIPRGPDGAFDKDWIQPAINIVTADDKHWIYYSGAQERHDIKGSRPVAIGLATLRLDGFAALEANGQRGSVVTKPFRLDDDTLEVNADATAGRLLVDVLDAVGQPIEGFTAKMCRSITTDDLRHKVAWKSEKQLASLVGQTIRLRFHLEGPAKLYSFQVLSGSEN